MPFPVFASGDVLNASDMNAVGLWLLQTKSVTTQTEITFDNIFTSTYLNYVVVINVSTATATGNMLWQERVGGVNAATSYSSAGVNYQLSGGTATQQIVGTGLQNVTSGVVGQFDPASGSQGHIIFEISAPQTSAYTQTTGRFTMSSGNTGITTGTIGATHFVTTIYDGFRVFVSAGNFTATARVYGYRN